MRKIRSLFVLFIVSVILALSVQPVYTQPCAASAVQVLLGGYPIGIEMLSDGPIVNSVTDNYALSGEIKTGDVIKKINGSEIHSRGDIYAALSDGELKLPISVTVLRHNSAVAIELMPEKDVCSDKLKLGFGVKEGVSGVGTMTCVTNGGKFYALGHSISDGESTSRFVCRSGDIYKCEISGIERPENGKTGKLIGRSVDCANPIGEIKENSSCGLRGMCFSPSGAPVYTLPREEVKPGRAQILTTVRGEPKYYDIEIVKAGRQSSPSEKGMVIHVTDEELIKYTGGILQGMSGSPILQNGRLAGAVTHVFTNDPTRGYGVYADWILAA